MSLINEALKRAREEALRREAASKRLPLTPVSRARPRVPWSALALVALAVALVASLIALVSVSSRLPAADPPVVAGAPSEALAEPDPGAMAESGATAEPELDVADSLPPSAPREDPTVFEPPSAFAEESAPAPQSPPSDRAAQDQQPPPSDRPPASAAAEGAGTRMFVGQAELPDGRIIDLGGIAWSETGPYALLNGQVKGIGEWVRGYQVIEISPSEVRLESADDRLSLRLK